MPRARLLLCIFLLAMVPTVIAQEERDHAAEVREGANVHAYLSYVGSATGTRSGTSESGSTLSETRTVAVRWEGPLTLAPAAGGKVANVLLGEWVVEGSSTFTSDHQREGYSLHEESQCEAKHNGTLGYQVEATPEPAGLRVVVKGYSVASMFVPDACHGTRVEVSWAGTDSEQTSDGFGAEVPLLHALEGGEYDAEVSFLVPYDSRGSQRFTYSEAVPHAGGVPAAVYCGMSGDATPWARGTCTAEGTLTVRNLVDPCPYLGRVYPERHAALATVQAPPATADEAAVRVWSGQNAEKVRAVLADQRTWQLLGCSGDLAPDPWEDIGRVLTMQRDALLRLLREGKLSREGVSELLGAERAMQLMGVGDASSTTLAEIMAASPAPANGDVEVRVHSPVSLHVWSEDGGHVGWNATTDASESTIAGATYEGAPGGAQSIVLPAGFYKVTVDELAAGAYLLDVTTNGTGADDEDSAIVRSQAGRTTSTHYAVTVGWDGPRLDVFPVRRMATPDVVAFVDPGQPSVSGAPGGREPAGDDAAEGSRGAPGLALAAALGALAVAAVARRRR